MHLSFHSLPPILDKGPPLRLAAFFLSDMAKKAVNVKQLMQDINRYLTMMHDHGRQVDRLWLTPLQYKALTTTLNNDVYRGVKLEMQHD